MPGVSPDDIVGFMSRIETKLDSTIKQMGDHETRLRVLESKSGARWDAIVGDVIKLIVAAALGYFLARYGI